MPIKCGPRRVEITSHLHSIAKRLRLNLNDLIKLIYCWENVRECRESRKIREIVV